MCGRFININKLSKLKKFFEINVNPSFNYSQSYNIAPSQNSLAISLENDFKFKNFNWGIDFFDKINNKVVKIINSRIETINNKIIFKESFFKKRCIIPTNGYYEWLNKNGKKLPFFIHIANLNTFFFAGIWKESINENNKLNNFSIITKNANKSICSIHNRMPIILSYNEAINYLENQYSYKELSSHSELENDIEYYQVSKIVNYPKNNSKLCIQKNNY
ncbi:MAG: putative SOS response-associated peptidase YedK [Alphaproteobacteria bacterium MarineAlpha5_Bin9]|nr:MAG: putative SOS response-associated peptidase YedK [Alphaproteobacteria bacterium MarineAlpha5_Bin9]|tara:strand:+ start:16129 stop:16785 length:657 start_codon:yes stop_codon:yes gene_type:complete